MSVNFSIEQLEFFLLVFVRISGFIFTAPFFNHANIPRRVKISLTFFVAVIVFMMLPVEKLQYSGVLGYGFLLIEELLLGIVMGFMTNICTMILAFAGQIIDQEIGFSMVQEMNPTANFTTTITGNLFTMTVMLIMIVTNLHLYILSAIVDSFKIVEVGEASINILMYKVMIKFMVDYFIIAFRIILPVFASILLTNVVLAILAKVAPQMNMFVIGMQLKVLIGIAVMVLIATLLPAITEFIYEEMKVMIKYVIAMF